MWLQHQQRMLLQKSSGMSIFEENLELSEKFQAKTNENGDFR